MNTMSERLNASKAWMARTIGTRLGMFMMLALGVLLSASAAHANNIYVAQNSTGASNGSDCADARTVSSLAGGDWTAGNTIHLCGTITSSVTAQGSGASGSPITILFEPGAKITAPAISTSGAIVLTGLSYIIVDGGSTVSCGYVNGSNVTCNNGNIQSTANGTGLANQVASIGIEADSVNNVEIRNLVIGPLYTHTSTSDLSQNPPGPLCVQFNYANNVSIHNNTMHDAGWCLNGGGGPSTNLNIYNNEIYNVDHGVGIGNNNTGVYIYGNHFHDFAAWDTSDNSFHHDGVHLFAGLHAAGNASVLSTAGIYDNLFDGDIGYNVTAWIFIEGVVQHLNMYNNLFYLAPGRIVNNGAIGLEGNGDTGDHNSIYNNTIRGSYSSGGGSCLLDLNQTNTAVRNNILLGCANLIGLGSDTFISGGLSNNVYEDITSDYGGTNTFSWNGCCTASFSTWVSSSGETGAVFGTLSSININATTGVLGAGSKAIGAGANLTGLGITTLDTDKGGTSRPGGNLAWDAGAYQYAVLSQIAPPTNLKATAQ